MAAVDSEQQDTRGDTGEDAVQHLVGFLSDAKAEVRLQAATALLEESCTPEGRNRLVCTCSTPNRAASDGAIYALGKLVGDVTSIAGAALSTLVNLSASQKALPQMISARFIDKLMENLRVPTSKDGGHHKNLNLMLLSNITITPEGASLFMNSDAEHHELAGLHLLRLVHWFLQYRPSDSQADRESKSNRVVVDEGEEEEEAVTVEYVSAVAAGGSDTDEWRFVAGILANITRIPEGRQFLLDWDRGVLVKLLPELHSSSVYRRRGVARMLRNLCVEKAHHEKLLAPVTIGGADLIQHALLRLAGPEPLEDHDMDASHPELYGAGKKREKDILVRKKIVEMLVCLTTGREARELMRKRKVYPIVREMHTDSIQVIEAHRRAKRRKIAASGQSVEGGIAEKDEVESKFKQ